MPFKTLASVLARGASLFAPQEVPIAATSIGAVTTAPGTLSGSFVVQPGGPDNAYIGVINGELGYQQLVVSINGNAINTSGTIQVQCTNNPASNQWQVPQYIYRQAEASGSGTSVFINTQGPVFFNNGRATSFIFGISGFAYVRIIILGTTGVLIPCTWTASTSPMPPVVYTPSITSGVPSADGATAAGTNDLVIAGNAINSSGSFVLSQQPALTALTWIGLRSPGIFRGSQFSASGSNVVWQPASTKKVRLMKYKIEVSADATIAGGAQPINLQFANGISTSSGVTAPAPIGYTHRVLVPSAAQSSFLGYDSGWIDLGNGVIGTTAGMPLNMGIQVPQPAAAITSPTWTIASNQWEAAAVGFKSASNLGNIKLVNQASSIALTIATNTTQGNAVFVFFRTVNGAGGTPVITVTDTALNAYTVLALVTNASDGANGSSMGLAYSINAIGLAANTITIAATNSPGSIESLYQEYSGLGSAGIDAAQVSATGNSTSPASGNYTPATVGDLVFTFMGTSANLAAVPVVPTNFRFIGNDRQAVFGTLAVADNFGNGSLATGQINVIACGTEE